MDLSKVLGEFYDEEEERGKDGLAAALADALAEQSPEAGSFGPDPEVDEVVSPPPSSPPAALVDTSFEPEPFADAGSMGAGTWRPPPEPADPVVAEPELSPPDDLSPPVAELPDAQPSLVEPPPSWHRGDDDVLPHRRSGRRLQLGRRGRR